MEFTMMEKSVKGEFSAAGRSFPPYGAGNNRPVFCLRGATLESVQGVGQNRHLKLKLQKSRVNFDGIFFSVTADECGVCDSAGAVDVGGGHDASPVKSRTMAMGLLSRFWLLARQGGRG